MSDSGCTSEESGIQEPNPGSRLGSLYDAYGAELFRYASMLLADSHSAEDALQQVFLKLARRGRTIRINSPWSYLRQAVRNECYRILRSRRTEEEMQRSDVSQLLESRSPAQFTEKKDEHIRLEQALRTLPPEQREVVHLKVYEKKTFKEISEMTFVSINTASSRYRYALDRLALLLTEKRGSKE